MHFLQISKSTSKDPGAHLLITEKFVCSRSRFVNSESSESALREIPGSLFVLEVDLLILRADSLLSEKFQEVPMIIK